MGLKIFALIEVNMLNTPTKYVLNDCLIIITSVYYSRYHQSLLDRIICTYIFESHSPIWLSLQFGWLAPLRIHQIGAAAGQRKRLKSHPSALCAQFSTFRNGRHGATASHIFHDECLAQKRSNESQ